MSPTYKILIQSKTVLTVLSLFTLVLVVIAASFNIGVSFILLLFSSIIILVMLIMVKVEMMTKALLLLGLAMVSTGFFMFYQDLSCGTICTDKQINDIKLLLQIKAWNSFMIYACAGAGGSIMATEAIKYSSDSPETEEKRIVIDKTERIQQLLDSVRTLKIIGIIIIIILILLYIQS